jgi:hypothetical protein
MPPFQLLPTELFGISRYFPDVRHTSPHWDADSPVWEARSIIFPLSRGKSFPVDARAGLPRRLVDTRDGRPAPIGHESALAGW